MKGVGRWKGRTVLGLALLMVMGAILRLAPISANRFHQDEALYSFWALQVTTGRDPILNHSPVDKPPLFIYTLALCFRFLGPSEVAARLPSELASVASIALLYYLAWRLYGRAVAMLAAALMALSPFNILFAPTAFTDPLMVAWVLAALCLAARGSLGWSGLALGLASATKQQGLFFAPLALVIGARCQPFQSGEELRRGLKKGLLLAAGFLAVMAPVAWWDSLRWRLQPNYFEQSLISYGGLALVDPSRWAERLADWTEILSYITASPFLNVLLLVGLPCLLLYDLVPSPSPHSREGGKRRAPAAFFDVTLSAFAILFLLGHWLLNFNIWDRYLLGLVPVLLLLLARIIWLASGALSSIHPSLSGRGRGRVDFHRRMLLVIVLLAATLVLSLGRTGLRAGPALTAARSGYPIGGDHGAYDGIDAIAAYFREHVPDGSVLYHHWLGWHYSFYLFDAPLVFRWYPSPEELATDALQVDDAQRYIVFPGGESTVGVRDALGDVSLGLRSVYSAYGRDPWSSGTVPYGPVRCPVLGPDRTEGPGTEGGDTSFTVYRIEDQE